MAAGAVWDGFRFGGCRVWMPGNITDCGRGYKKIPGLQRPGIYQAMDTRNGWPMTDMGSNWHRFPIVSRSGAFVKQGGPSPPLAN